MEQFWGIEKDVRGKWATDLFGPLGSHQRDVLDAWIADAPDGTIRSQVDAGLGEWVRKRREQLNGTAYRNRVWLADYQTAVLHQERAR